MEPTTRRSFLIKGGVGAAGVAAGMGTGFALSGAVSAEPELSASELEELDQPMVIHVADASAGKVEILVGEREVEFTDKALVAKVLRATR
jgi:hypothetical protein